MRIDLPSPHNVWFEFIGGAKHRKKLAVPTWNWSYTKQRYVPPPYVIKDTIDLTEEGKSLAYLPGRYSMRDGVEIIRRTEIYRYTVVHDEFDRIIWAGYVEDKLRESWVNNE